jgi:type I restriction enzyme S subunit
MGGKWPIVPLGKLYDFRSGLSKPSSAFGSGYSFLSFKDVFYNYFVPENLTELVNSTTRERESCSVRKGDVFLTRTSETMEELGMSCVALRDYEDATFNGFTKRLRPKSGVQIVPEYAGFYFRSWRFRCEVTAMSTMSTRASLNNEMLERLTMSLPSVDEQFVIGHILKRFDDKIELNRQMNRTLEKMAQAIFKSWFIDFDPVVWNAVQAGKPVPQRFAETAARYWADQYAGHPGLPKEIVDLFPDSFVESELGLIPEGWGVVRLLDIASLLSGGTPKTSEENYWGGKIKWASAKDVSQCSSRYLIDTERNITEAGLNNSSTKIIPKGSVVVVARGATCGRWCVLGEDIAMNQTCYALAPNIPEQLVFLRQLVPAVIANLVLQAHGSVFDTITTRTFKTARVVLPPDNLIRALSDVLLPIEQRVLGNIYESRTLTNLRDTLLPKLISGELPLADAERFIEGAEI